MAKLKLGHFINFKSQSAATKFQLTGLCYTFLTEPLGLNLLVENYKVSSRTIAAVVFFGSYIFSGAKTFYTYRNDVYQILECICMLGLGLPVSE